VRIGILGGTFNPPHLGHLICAQEAYVQLGLDRVIMIPARIPPHKPVEDEPGATHRYELCRCAVDGDDRFQVSELEIERDGPSWTVDTLAELNSRAPENELFLIVGGDVAAGIPHWREPERVLSLATLAVAKRGGTARERVEAALGTVIGGERTAFFRMPRVAISSTDIRRRVRAGEPITYLTPDPVVRYIEEYGLYQRGGTV
jgi:nicotinate-nucleotide adenylyltransferase